MNESLRQIIKNTIFLSENDMECALSFFKPMTLKTDDYFLKVGQRCNQVAFVKSGMLRMFYPNDKGEETTCCFSFPNEFVTLFSAFTTQSPSTKNIQAILPTECFVISKHDLENLYIQIPSTQELGRKAAENVAMLLGDRMTLFLNSSADERYRDLLKNNPILLQTVPLQYLASYLGITPQHLSRLRKNTIRVIS